MAYPWDKCVLKSVRKRSVADVVKQDGDLHSPFLFLGDLVSLLTKGVDGTAHEVHGADGVVEAGVIGPWVDEVGQAKLAYAAQSLEVGVVNQLVN